MSITKTDHIYININNLQNKPSSKRIQVVTDGCTLYFNCQHLMVQLGTEARCFFDYLCEQMNSDTNEVRIDARLKDNFIQHISRITSTKITPSVSSLNVYVSIFKRLGLIISAVNTQKEYYSVNPKYAYKGQKKKRLLLLKNMIEERIKSNGSLKGLIDKPERELGINNDGKK